MKYRLLWMRKHRNSNRPEKLYEKRFRTYDECMRMENILYETENGIDDGYDYYIIIRQEETMGYIIVGDSKEYGYKDCLVQVLRTNSLEEAKKMFHRFLNDTRYEVSSIRNRHTNLRLKSTTSDEEWWNDPFLAN